MNSTQFFWCIFASIFGGISLAAFIEYTISKFKQYRHNKRYMALKRSRYNRYVTTQTYIRGL